VALELTRQGQRFGHSPRGAVLLFSLLLASALFGVSTSPAHACRCIPQTPAQQYDVAKVVFAGKLSRLEYFVGPLDAGRSSAPTRWQWATFSVAEVWKGIDRSSAVVIADARDGQNCGLDFLPGATYLVLAGSRNDGTLGTGSCSGTTILSNKVRETYGLARGSPPTVTDQAPGIPTPVVPRPLATARAYGVSEVDIPPLRDRSDPRVPSTGIDLAVTPGMVAFGACLLVLALIVWAWRRG
jgi:hypothetical protein